MNRILVVRAGALGDVILTFPALRALRRRYPDARVDVVGYPALWEIAGDLVDRVESIDHPRFSGLFTGRPDADLLVWLDSTDLAVAWTVRDPSDVFRAAGIPYVIHASPYPPPGVHAAEWLAETLQPAIGSVARSSVSVIDRSRSFRISRQDGAQISETLPGVASDIGVSVRSSSRNDGLRTVAETELRATSTPISVVIHPGAGAAWKRWPTERFAELAMQLRQKGLSITLVEGPADGDAVRAVLELTGDMPVLRGLSLPQLTEALQVANLFIGNDSGVTHLAAWLGVPAIALFGPTDPASWAPLGDVRVLRACSTRAARQGEIRVCVDPDCMAGLDLESVLEAAMEVLARDESGVENHVDDGPMDC